MKTAEEIISICDATVAAYSQGPVWYRSDIIRYMNEYADQFRKPEKKTIEESLAGCRDEFKPALRTWLEYKAEKNQRYKPKGLESLVKKFNKFEGTPDQLMHVIESCMECNYAGIVWSKNYTYGKSTKPTTDEAVNGFISQ